MIPGFLLGLGILTVGITIGYWAASRTGSQGYTEEVYSAIDGQKSQLPFVAREEFRAISTSNFRAAFGIEPGFITFGVFGGFVLLLNGAEAGMSYRTAVAGTLPASR